MTTRSFGGLTCEEVLDLAPGFVLGALEDAEMVTVRAHLAACPEAHAEVEELGGVIPYLAESLEPMEPPTDLRARILTAAKAERPVRTLAPTPAPIPTRGAAELVPRPAASRPRWRVRLDWAFAAAAVLAVVILGAWNLTLQGQLSNLTAYRQGVIDVLDAAAAPGSLLAILTADSGAGPRGLAALRADGTVVLAMRDLSPTTAGQVYETWIIAGDGAPVPVGGFTVGPDGTATFVTRQGPVAAGAIVAVTLEPGPGATTPTLPIVSKGVASPPPA
jgi:anti-sigma-K factor RskA